MPSQTAGLSEAHVANRTNVSLFAQVNDAHVSI
jgi:hypothetical protein